MMPVEIARPDHVCVFVSEYVICILSDVCVEGILCVGIGAVVVDVKDCDDAVVTLDLDCCQVVSVRDANGFPVARVKRRADPYYRSYHGSVCSSVCWED